MKKLILIFIFFVIAAGARESAGHGSTFALKSEAGEYHVDVHYPYAFEADKPVWLNFFLSNNRDDSPAVFSDVDASILKDGEVIFQANISKREDVATAAILTFPEGGRHVLHLTFNDRDGKELAKASFDLEVSEKPAENLRANLSLSDAQIFLVFALAVFISLLLGVYWGKRGK